MMFADFRQSDSAGSKTSSRLSRAEKTFAGLGAG